MIKVYFYIGKLDIGSFKDWFSMCLEGSRSEYSSCHFCSLNNRLTISDNKLKFTPYLNALNNFAFYTVNIIIKPELESMMMPKNFLEFTYSTILPFIINETWSSCLGGYSSVPDDYPPVLGCEEHVSSLGVFVA